MNKSHVKQFVHPNWVCYGSGLMFGMVLDPSNLKLKRTHGKLLIYQTLIRYIKSVGAS